MSFSKLSPLFVTVIRLTHVGGQAATDRAARGPPAWLDPREALPD